MFPSGTLVHASVVREPLNGGVVLQQPSSLTASSHEMQSGGGGMVMNNSQQQADQTASSASVSTYGPQHAAQLVEAMLESDNDDEEEDEFEDQLTAAAFFGSSGRGNRFRWEQGCERSWDNLREESDGRLVLLDDTTAMSRRLRKLRQLRELAEANSNVRRGIIRNVVMIIDESESMRAVDVKPDRHHCVMQAAESFIREFFSANPLSQMGMIGLQESRANLITLLSANPDDQIRVLQEHRDSSGCRGSVSVQAGLERAVGLLSCFPPYGTREVIFLFGSISSIDAGDIDLTINDVKAKGIQVSVVGLSPELHVLRKLCDQTGGTYSVALSAREHFRELLFIHLRPPAWGEAMQPRLVSMGFPRRTRHNTVSLCMCHNKPCLTSFICPRCRSKNCEIPSRCRACGLHLISCAHIYRTFHHLQPPPPYIPLIGIEDPPMMLSSSSSSSGVPIPSSLLSSTRSVGGGAAAARGREGFGDSTAGGLMQQPCGGCGRVFTEDSFSECPRCLELFCFDCDAYIHDVLHQCVTCMKLEHRMAEEAKDV